MRERENTQLLVIGPDVASGRHTLSLRAAKEGERRAISVLILAGGETALEQDLLGVCAAPETDVRIQVTSVARDAARIAVRGTCCAKKNAHHAAVSFRHDALVLSKTAATTSVPSLEILTDDASAHHAATIGGCDEETLVYLMSRGVTREEAIRLLVRAFAERALEGSAPEQRDEAETRIARFLEGIE